MVPFIPPVGCGKVQCWKAATTQVCSRPPPSITAVGAAVSTCPLGSSVARTVRRPRRSLCSMSARSKQP